MHKTILDDTIAAISTPIGEGGIGIIRLSGPLSLRIADKIFVSRDGKKPSTFKSHTVHYGHILSIDEVLLTVMRAPKTYTKEDIVEINCHGGAQAMKEVLELCLESGCRVAEPGEFTKRAFLNGRIDLAQAEAVLDMIRAKTEGSLKVAQNQLEGELSKKINQLRDKAVDVASQIEAAIDFPEEELETISDGARKDVDEVVAGLKHLLDTSHEGMILRDGVLAVICGKPNAGKSSLMNLLLKRDRVIVTPVPGTTRDAIEEMIALKGVPVRLVDTAGIGSTKDTVEIEGIERSKKYLKDSDIALLVLDGSTELDRQDRNIIKLLEKKKKLVIINKIDLPSKLDKKTIAGLFKGDTVIDISVKTRKKIEVLEKAVADLILSGSIVQREGAIVSSARHKSLLEKACRNMQAVRKAMDKGDWPELVAVDIKEAIFNLGLVVGKSVSDDILDRIFEKFCIGK